MKAHTGTDAESGIVHPVTASAVNVDDVNAMGELLHGNEDSPTSGGLSGPHAER